MVDMPVIVRRQDLGALRLDHGHDQALCRRRLGDLVFDHRHDAAGPTNLQEAVASGVSAEAACALFHKALRGNVSPVEGAETHPRLPRTGRCPLSSCSWSPPLRRFRGAALCAISQVVSAGTRTCPLTAQECPAMPQSGCSCGQQLRGGSCSVAWQGFGRVPASWT